MHVMIGSTHSLVALLVSLGHYSALAETGGIEVNCEIPGAIPLGSQCDALHPLWSEAFGQGKRCGGPLSAEVERH